MEIKKINLDGLDYNDTKNYPSPGMYFVITDDYSFLGYVGNTVFILWYTNNQSDDFSLFMNNYDFNEQENTSKYKEVLDSVSTKDLSDKEYTLKLLDKFIKLSKK